MLNMANALKMLYVCSCVVYMYLRWTVAALIEDLIRQPISVGIRLSFGTLRSNQPVACKVIFAAPVDAFDSCI